LLPPRRDARALRFTAVDDALIHSRAVASDDDRRVGFLRRCQVRRTPALIWSKLACPGESRPIIELVIGVERVVRPRRASNRNRNV